MFTGIITHTGTLIEKNRSVFWFNATTDFLAKVEQGTSIAVNGACLTVIEKNQHAFSVEIMPETQKKTMLGSLTIGEMINLELPATPTSFLSGHIVQGHIDDVGQIQEIKPEGNSRIITIAVVNSIARYLVEKGSIAVNGISLTIIAAKAQSFSIGILPYTWKNTMLHRANLGDGINIEVDILAKYVEKLLQEK